MKRQPAGLLSFFLSPRAPRLRAITVFALISSLAHLASAQSPPQPQWKLCWSDEFNGDSIDKSKWTFDQGNGFGIPGTNIYVSGWGNDELEYYTSRPQNSYVKDGLLHIRAIKESYQGFNYTSAKMLT